MFPESPEIGGLGMGGMWAPAGRTAGSQQGESGPVRPPTLFPTPISPGASPRLRRRGQEPGQVRL